MAEEGRRKGADEKFCYECGELIRARAEICPRCGVRQPYIGSFGMKRGANFLEQGQPRDRIAAGLLAVIGGGLGLHKFYLGRPGWGIVYILLVWTGISVVLGLVEGVLLLVMTEEEFQRRYGGAAWNK